MNSEPIADFLAYLKDCKVRHGAAQANQSDAENKTQDLLHALELEEHGYHETARLSLELKQARRDRRAAKDEVEELAPIVAYTDAHPADIKTLERLLGEVRKAEYKHQNRFYTPKCREVADGATD